MAKKQQSGVDVNRSKLRARRLIVVNTQPHMHCIGCIAYTKL